MSRSTTGLRTRFLVFWRLSFSETRMTSPSARNHTTLCWGRPVRADGGQHGH